MPYHWTNFHSHTRYCDGTGHPETYIQSAIQHNIRVYGFSSHAPVPYHNPWAMKTADLSRYIDEVRSLAQKYASEVEILCGVEKDFIPGHPLPAWIDSLDYHIGSVHFCGTLEDGRPWEIDGTEEMFMNGLTTIFQNDIKKAVGEYYHRIQQMVISEIPPVIGHLDKIKFHNKSWRFFDEDSRWYRQLVIETLRVIQSAGCIVEINTRGLYKKRTESLYPSFWILQQIQQLNIPVQLNSDCHHPSEVTGKFQLAAEAMAEAGIKAVRILYRGKWQDMAFSKKGIKFPGE